MLRGFTYIDDIGGSHPRDGRRQPRQPVSDAAQPDPATSNAPYRVFNIGNSEPVPLMAYIAALEKVTGIQAQKNFLPMQPGDVPATSADTAGWTRGWATSPKHRGSRHRALLPLVPATTGQSRDSTVSTASAGDCAGRAVRIRGQLAAFHSRAGRASYRAGGGVAARPLGASRPARAALPRHRKRLRLVQPRRPATGSHGALLRLRPQSVACTRELKQRFFPGDRAGWSSPAPCWTTST